MGAQCHASEIGSGSGGENVSQSYKLASDHTNLVSFVGTIITAMLGVLGMSALTSSRILPVLGAPIGVLVWFIFLMLFITPARMWGGAASGVTMAIEQVSTSLEFSIPGEPASRRFALAAVIRINNSGPPTSLTGWTALVMRGDQTVEIGPSLIQTTFHFAPEIVYGPDDDLIQKCAETPLATGAIVHGVLLCGMGDAAKALLGPDTQIYVQCHDVNNTKRVAVLTMAPATKVRIFPRLGSARPPGTSPRARAIRLSEEIIELVSRYRAESSMRSFSRMENVRRASTEEERTASWERSNREDSQLHDNLRAEYSRRFATDALALVKELSVKGFADERLASNAEHFTNMLVIEDIALRLGALAKQMP